jgi:hypothetical protein
MTINPRKSGSNPAVCSRHLSGSILLGEVAARTDEIAIACRAYPQQGRLLQEHGPAIELPNRMWPVESRRSPFARTLRHHRLGKGVPLRHAADTAICSFRMRFELDA